jgi:zona occludens toxin (predicted ATPase)
MALIFMTGVPGTGKTLYAIQKYIIEQLKKGKKVFTNIDGLIPERIALLFNLDIFDVQDNLKVIKEPEFFYKEMEENATAVIDEVQNIFGNRNWQSEANTECIKYINEHRHYGHKLVFVTPHIDGVDAGIRRVAQFTYKHKSMSSIGSVKTVRCAIFDQCDLTKSPLQVFTWRHDKRVYDCYSSYFTKTTTEQKVRIHPLRNFIFIITAIATFFAFKNTGKFLERMNRRKKTKQKTENIIIRKDKQNKTNKGIIINGMNYDGADYERGVK